MGLELMSPSLASRPLAPMLVVLDDQGDWISHEVGGYACHAPEVRGRLQSLNLSKEEIDSIENKLRAHFTGPAYGGWCDRGITVDTENWLNELFEEYQPLSLWRVDPKHLNDCQEAWIYICNIKTDLKAVLIWQNSD